MDEDLKTVTLHCPCCDRSYLIELTDKQLEAYKHWKQSDEEIQDLLPDLSTVQRESLISGFCRECQRKFFGNEADNSDE